MNEITENRGAKEASGTKGSASAAWGSVKVRSDVLSETL